MNAAHHKISRESSSSHAQLDIWLSSSIATDPAVLNLLWLLDFKGHLECNRLKLALTEIIRRHAGLRSTFHWKETSFEQTILPPSDIALLQNVASPSDIESQARDFACAPFELSRGPLFRFKLFKLDIDHYQLLCCFHHLIIDGMSWPLLVDELLEIMKGNALPDGNVQYADFCAWQQFHLASGKWNEAKRYWRDLCAAVPAAWQIPTDNIPSGPIESAGECHASFFTEALGRQLRDAAIRWHTTPFRIAFAAFAVFLAAMTRRSEVIVATTFIGRSEPDFKRAIGMFGNTGIIRMRIEEDMRFCDVVAQIGHQLNEGIKHQDYPFFLAVRDNAAPRNISRSPFTNVSFTKLPRSESLRIPGLEVNERRIFLPFVNRDLSVYLQDNLGQFCLTWTYRQALFKTDTIQRWSMQFENLVGDALVRPDVPIMQLTIGSDREYQQIIRQWNATDYAFESMKPLHRLIEDQVERTPDRIAVRFSERRITYRELNNSANHLAAQLRSRGVSRGTFVPLLFPPSEDLLVAELAVMKCGGAFIPLGMEWPRNRLNALLARIGSRFLVADQQVVSGLLDSEYEILNIRWAGDFNLDQGNQAADVLLDDPIYCIFTSGSTGEPKGAVNCHRGIVNRLFSMTAMFGNAVNDVVLATSPATVDTLIWQFFWPLICGGQVVIAPRQHLVSGEQIALLLKTHAITITDFIPSIFQGVVRFFQENTSAAHELEKLRTIIIGGEAINSKPVYDFKKLFPTIDLFNSYGPTEASIGTIFFKVPDEYMNPIPLGRPLPNVRAVILDGYQRLTPIGMVGELYLGGACVGLGYLGDPSATAEKFVRNPFPALNSDVLYRTGDLARYEADGNIEYLGRIDHQIKIRGNRIEPGEIESALMRHPAIEQSVVLLAQKETAEAHLAAYLVIDKHSHEPSAVELREFLQAELPIHMLPSTYIRIPRIPLAPSGKTDRNAVAKMEGHFLLHAKTHAAPRNEWERLIFETWQELLEIKCFSIHDHFFIDLGADSLNALLFTLNFEKRTDQKVNVRHLFEHPTVASLACCLKQQALPETAGGEHRLKSDDKQHIPEQEIMDKQRKFVASWKGITSMPDSFLFGMNMGGHKPPLFWCFQGYDELERLSQHLGEDQPVVGMRSGHLVMDYTDVNIDVLATRYLDELTALRPDGLVFLGGNCQGGTIARRMAKHLHKSGRQVGVLFLMEQTQFIEYQGKVALIFGKDSHLNPYRTKQKPDLVFASCYPEGYTVDFISGAHGEFFRDENLPSLAAVITRRLETFLPLAAR